MAIDLEITKYLEEEEVDTLINQFPVPADYDGVGSKGTNDHLGLGRIHVCKTEPVIRRYTLTGLTAWVDMPVPEEYGCIDIGERRVIPDVEVRDAVINAWNAKTGTHTQVPVPMTTINCPPVNSRGPVSSKQTKFGCRVFGERCETCDSTVYGLQLAH